jgi:hypothetical protein
MENEARMLQAQIEENLREREEKAEEMAQNHPPPPRTREETEQADQRAVITNLARHDMSRNAIHELSRVRAARSMEALQLRHAVDSPNSTAITVIGEGADAKTIRVPAGRSNPNDFNNTHLRKLEQGIARLDESIMARVADMYRRSVQEGREQRADITEEEMNETNGEG